MMVLFWIILIPLLGASAGSYLNIVYINKNSKEEVDLDGEIIAKHFKNNFPLLNFIGKTSVILFFVNLFLGLIIPETNYVLDSLFFYRFLICIIITFIIFTALLFYYSLKHFSNEFLKIFSNTFYSSRKRKTLSFIHFILSSALSYSVIFIISTNILLDFSKGEKKEVTILSKEHHRNGKNPDTFYIKFKPSIYGTKELSITRKFYHESSYNKKMTLVIHNGLYGLKYIDYKL
jgi:hypothetical protein